MGHCTLQLYRGFNNYEITMTECRLCEYPVLVAELCA